jgi:signal transduction protein with GAF and PtsI domain
MLAPSFQVPDVDSVHQVAQRIASADPLHEVLEQVLTFVSIAVRCDSCFIYALERGRLVLRASMNPHPEAVDHLKMKVAQGITGWVAAHQEPVAIPEGAFKDSCFQFFNELPEDRYESFLSVPLLCRGRLVGVINVQHRETHIHSESEVRLISTLGFLVGAEIEMARLETENSLLAQRLESRKVIERAKGILQRGLHVTEEQAYLALRKQSRQRRKSMRELAEAIVLSEEVKRH